MESDYSEILPVEGPLTAENPFYMSLHTYHLSDFEGTFLLLALCDHFCIFFFSHSKESRPQAFAEAVNKVSHLSATRKLRMDYISQELKNRQLL